MVTVHLNCESTEDQNLSHNYASIFIYYVDPQPPIIMYLVPIYEIHGDLRAIRIIVQLNNQVSHVTFKFNYAISVA